MEASIQRELENERIKAQLKIDIRKAGGDQEAINAARARAGDAFERLSERDELADEMAFRETDCSDARYQDELDTINAHWDAVEGATNQRHADELTTLDEKHGDQMTAPGVQAR